MTTKPLECGGHRITPQRLTLSYRRMGGSPARPEAMAFKPVRFQRLSELPERSLLLEGQPAWPNTPGRK